MDEFSCHKKIEPTTVDPLAGPLVQNSRNTCNLFDFEVLQDNLVMSLYIYSNDSRFTVV